MLWWDEAVFAGVPVDSGDRHADLILDAVAAVIGTHRQNERSLIRLKDGKVLNVDVDDKNIDSNNKDEVILRSFRNSCFLNFHNSSTYPPIKAAVQINVTSRWVDPKRIFLVWAEWVVEFQ